MKTYHGKACVNGHGTLRYRAGGSCIVCHRLNSRKRFLADPAGWRARSRARYASVDGRLDRRGRNLKKKYGMTLEQYAALEGRQNGVCAICGEGPRGKNQRLVVDHSHATGIIRALLCQPCNLGLGAFKDKVFSLMKAVQYLQSFGEG